MTARCAEIPGSVDHKGGDDPLWMLSPRKAVD